MAVETKTMTVKGPNAVAGAGPSQKLVVVQRTIEVTAGATNASTYSVCSVPANAQLVGYLSKIQWDDLASTGSPTIDVGLFGDQITADDNALQDGLDVTSASSAILPNLFQADGKEFWEYVSGQTTNPGGDLEIRITLQDAAANSGGTLNAAIAYIAK